VTISNELLELETGLPAHFERHDDRLELEAVVAERKTFLSREKLTYRARVEVDDDARKVRFHEHVKETARGLTGGVSFSTETTKLKGKERSGVAEERSSWLGKRYDYRLDYAAVRDRVEEAARANGYEFEVSLR
jgi:hypothetical protein